MNEILYFYRTKVNNLTNSQSYDHDLINTILRGGEKILELLWYFVAGFFAWNSVPHLVKGITGQTHMTPFKRVSSPLLNVIWSFINVVLALYVLGLASGNGGLTLPWSANLEGVNLWVFLAGGLVVGLYLANFWSNPNARLPWQKD